VLPLVGGVGRMHCDFSCDLCNLHLSCDQAIRTTCDQRKKPPTILAQPNPTHTALFTRNPTPTHPTQPTAWMCLTIAPSPPAATPTALVRQKLLMLRALSLVHPICLRSRMSIRSSTFHSSIHFHSSIPPRARFTNIHTVNFTPADCIHEIVGTGGAPCPICRTRLTHKVRGGVDGWMGG